MLIYLKTNGIIAALIYFALLALRKKINLRSWQLSKEIEYRNKKIKKVSTELAKAQIDIKIAGKVKMMAHDIKKPFSMLKDITDISRESKLKIEQIALKNLYEEIVKDSTECLAMPYTIPFKPRKNQGEYGLK